MPLFKEIIFIGGAVLLAIGLIWAIIYYRRRNRANDPITEKATHEMYKHPETYPEKREELKKKIHPS